MNLARRAVAEGVATAFLLAAVVGSGIMGERLAGGSVGLALLANTMATGAALVAVARSLGDTFAGIQPADVPGFLVAQLLGAGAATALFRWLVPTLPAVAPRVVARSERVVGGRS